MESYNYISHSARGVRKVQFDDQEEIKGEKRFNLSFANVSDSCSTHATDAEFTPSSDFGDEGFGSRLEVIMEKGESQYEQPRTRTHEEVDYHRAILAAKSRAFDENAEEINAVHAQADGVLSIVAQTEQMIENW